MVKESVQGNDVKFSVDEKGAIDGLNIYGGDSVGAMRVPDKIDLVGESLVGWGRDGELQIAKPMIWAAGKLGQNPVVKGLTSKSKTVASFVNEMYEHNMDIVKTARRGEFKEQSLQTKLYKYENMGNKSDVMIANSYFEYLGLPENTPWKNLPKSLFKDKNLLNFDDYLDEWSQAFVSGKSNIPSIAKSTKEIHENIMEPITNQLIELGKLAPNVKPYGAERYLTRIFDKPEIIANKLKKTQYLEGKFAESNDKVIKATSKLNELKNSHGEVYQRYQASVSPNDKVIMDRLQKELSKEQKKLQNNIIKGKYSPDMLVGDAGMSYEHLQHLKKLRKPLNNIKKELKHKEDELKVHSRRVNEGRKPGEKNKEKDQQFLKLEKELESLRDKLKSERLKIHESVKEGKVPKEIVFKGKNDTYYLKKRNKGTLQFRKILDETDLWDSARSSIDNILSLSEDDMANQILGSMQRGSSGESFLMTRVLLLEDVDMYKNKMLIRDPRRNIKAFVTRAGRIIEMEKYLKNKGWDGKSDKVGFLTDGIYKDYKQLEDISRVKFENMRQGVEDPKKLQKINEKEQKSNIKLDKALRSDLNLCEDTYRRITGGYQVPNSDLGKIKAARFFANWGYATQLGALLLVSLQDAVSSVYRQGPKNLIQGGVLPLIKNIVKMKNFDNVRLKEQAADLRMATESYTALLKFRFTSETEYDLPMGMLERAAENSASAMGLLNFTNMWSDAVTFISTNSSTSRIIRDLKKFEQGTLSKNYERQLGVVGLNDKGIAKLINTLTDEFGEESEGAFLANWNNWHLSTRVSPKEALLAKDYLQNAVRQEVRSTIFRGKDIASYPSGYNPNGVSQAFTMYMGYMFNATANYTIPLFQRFDPNKIMGAAAMMAVGSLTNPLRLISRGEEPDLDPARLFWGGVLNSGVGGIAVDLFNRANAIGDIIPSLVIDRYSGKGLELLAGMPGTVADVIFKLGGQFANNEWNKHDLKKAKRVIPLAEALEFRYLTNSWIDSLDIPKTRSKARKSKD
jgi:hypothetical protein